MSKTNDAIELARVSRATNRCPEGWTHSGNLNYHGPEGAWYNGMRQVLHRSCGTAAAYDIHAAAAMVALGLRFLKY